jgi:hypothetical protein
VANLINGAGVLVAISALPMLAGMLLREGTLAIWLRRLALLLALLLPAIFMVLAAFYLAPSSNVPFDFTVNYDAAQALYAHGANPYSVQAAYSFPFPTFYFYWLASGFGALSKSATWIVWWIANAAVWLGCVLLMWRTLPGIVSVRGRDCLRYVCAAIPAITTLWQGQTALLILAGLTALHLALLSNNSRLMWISGGAGLAWATLIKPQLALVGVGIGLWTLFVNRAHRWNEVRSILWIAGSAVLVGTFLIGLTLILPGGVTLDTYQRFVSEALPKVARPGDSIEVIGSPAFVIAALATRLGASGSTADVLSTIVTLIVLAVAAFWTLRRVNRPLTEISAGWGVWAMVAPRVTWTWYAVWCLPFFLLAVHEAIRTRSRLVLFVVVLALLNLQLASIPVEAVTILLLIALVWTSFREPINA